MNGVIKEILIGFAGRQTRQDLNAGHTQALEQY